MNTLETLKNALLISLVVMLIYVLYKRLIKVLGKDNINGKYPHIGNALRIESTEGFIDVELKNEAYLIVEIYSNDGSKVSTVAEGDFKLGNHSFSFSVSEMQRGKYYYKVTSPYQESSQYFELS